MSSSSGAVLSEQVYAGLMARLADREPSLGEHLKAHEVARKLSVSPATARKAIFRLVGDGWLTIGDNGRPVVTRHPPRSAVPRTAPKAGPSEQAYQAVLDLALNRAFRRGQVVKAKPLAEKLEISLPTVRSALDRLCHDGVLQRVPRRGWRFAELSPAEIRTMFEVRRRLEPMVLVRAFTRIDDKVIDSLLAETSEILADFGNVSRMRRLHAEARFHRSLAEMAGDSVLTEVLNPLIRKMMMVVSVTRGLSKSSWPEHKRILEAIKRRDLEAATECLKRDLADPLDAGFADWD